MKFKLIASPTQLRQIRSSAADKIDKLMNCADQNIAMLE